MCLQGFLSQTASYTFQLLFPQLIVSISLHLQRHTEKCPDFAFWDTEWFSSSLQLDKEHSKILHCLYYHAPNPNFCFGN